MNIAQYLSTSADQGGNGLYPLSVQTLNFIQEQIRLLHSFCIGAFCGIFLSKKLEDSIFP